MATVTISSDFSIVIPKSVRERFHLRPGQELRLLVFANHIVLLPVQPIRTARGCLPGLDTSVPREEGDRV